MYCIFFFCSLVVFLNGFFIHFRWSIGARPFRIPIRTKLCTSQESTTLDIHFFTLGYILWGGQRSTETRERERGEGEGEGGESIGSRCALIVVLLELTNECCYEKARNVCLLTNYFISSSTNSREIMESFLRKIQTLNRFL